MSSPPARADRNEPNPKYGPFRGRYHSARPRLLGSGRFLTASRRRPPDLDIGSHDRGESSCLVRRVVEGKNVFYIAGWSYELGRMGVCAGLAVRWWRVSGLRLIACLSVAAAPAGARVRARLRVSPQVRAAGPNHRGSLAGRDLAARCAEGRLGPKGRAVSRAARKRALTARSSSRWAGAITRTSEDQWSLAQRNLRAARASLQARVRRIEARLVIPAGGRPGRTRGYATPAERHWLGPLREHHPKATGDHAAALVTGRRGLGHRARRRATGNHTAPAEAARPAQARPRTTPTWPGPHPGRSPPPHEAPGSHPAPRPAGLTGSWQATRQPRTVRGRRLARTISR